MLKNLFAPKPPLGIKIQPFGLEFIADSKRTVLESALDAGIGFPYDCKVGTCGSCRFRLDEGRISELSPSAATLTREELECGWRLGCQALPRSSLAIYLTDLFDPPTYAPEDVEGHIDSIRALTHDIVEVSIALSRSIPFSPGQYAELSVAGIEGARSYSFAAWEKGGTTHRPSFHIRKVPGGKFTEWLFAESRARTAVRVRGPMGRFGLRQSESPLLLVGGGSGLAPLKCILEYALAAGCSRPATLLFGARIQADLFCVERIDEIAKHWRGKFTFIPILSLEPEASGWQGARGLVTEAIATLPSLQASQAYLCGPPAMVDAAEIALMHGGMSEASIFADRFFDRTPVRPLDSAMATAACL